MREEIIKKKCQLCIDQIKAVDYKDINLLKGFVSPSYGRILPKRVTGNCSKHQRMVTRAIKRARHLALLPFTGM